MKKLLFYILCFLPLLLRAQHDSITSQVYAWKEPVIAPGTPGGQMLLTSGSTRDMSWMQLTAGVLSNGPFFPEETVPQDEERLYIVKEGMLTVLLKDSIHTLGPGSIALLMPGEKFILQNNAGILCRYYSLSYRSRNPVNTARGRESGGSLLLNRNKIPYKPHDKGGIRNYYERATAMCSRMEMHVTTLNGNIKSHEPHTHKAQEIVIMINGNTEMQIGQSFYKGTSGDIFFLGSEVLHAIRNTADSPCTYFAFQFE